jgi:hypothetical protein
MSDKSHLRVASEPETPSYTYAKASGGGTFKLPPRDRVPHAEKLKTDLMNASADALTRRQEQGLQGRTKAFVYTFRSEPDHELVLESLERRQFGIEILSVGYEGNIMKASIRVPEGELKRFLKLVDDYEKKLTAKGKPKNQKLIESIASIRLAVVEDLWQDTIPIPNPDDAIWWEVWVPTGPGGPVATHHRFRELVDGAGLQLSEQFISFPERVVTLAYGTQRQFSSSLALLAEVAELRKAKELAGDYVQLPPRYQRQFVDEAIGRIQPPPADAPAVLLLDTGVNRGHPLLALALDESDAQAVRPEWGTADHDHYQHGTTMAGIALYGDLINVFDSSGPILLRHRLESVKLLPPPPGTNKPEAYGAVTQEAVARAEVQAATRNRAVCLTITADSRDQGLPSSWSAAVDQMCAGELDNTRRLVFVAAGNIRGELHTDQYSYHDYNCTQAGIEDPAQSWNAITVGAVTEKIFIKDPDYQDWQPMAEPGDLCPRSRTSLAWPADSHAGWPLKPDIVMEGGNYAEREGERVTLDDLSLLTTIVHPTGRLLETTSDTSPATAAAARFAAILWSYYPRFWPETVRGLMVHSARWTPKMLAHYPGDKKSQVQECLRCYGYGVPQLQKALWSAENAVTLIYEGELQPYQKPGSEVVTKEMHLHELPWPKEVLEGLGETHVSMRITLSYFIEPSPGRRGWTNKHRYQSHGLRFDVIRPLEGIEEFRKRLSRTEWDDPKQRPGSVEDTRNWVIGDNGRTHGSLHSDWWEGDASMLARCNRIAVFPVTGWWRERPHLERWGKKARYSLIVTIETPGVDVDLYAQIVNETTILTELDMGE